MENTLIEGDALKPESTDLIAQRAFLPLRKAPKGSGWRILTGGPMGNLWGRIAYRYECEGGQ